VAYGLPPLHLLLLQCMPHEVKGLLLLFLGQRPLLLRLLLGMLLFPLVKSIQDVSKNGPAATKARAKQGWDGCGPSRSQVQKELTLS